jgi:hypothetical protein
VKGRKDLLFLKKKKQKDFVFGPCQREKDTTVSVGWIASLCLQ